MMSLDSGPGVIVTVSSENDHDTISRLLIRSAAPRNSGQYKCVPATAPPHSITVHIINSDKPAAIHHKNTTSNSSSGSGSGHMPSVSLQVFLVGLLPLTLTSAVSDFIEILIGTVAWWRVWTTMARLGICRWWRSVWWWRRAATSPSCCFIIR
ncbi:hypothetical protein E2C01_092257 [Portunus trituberculatus]|uniref:Ig-like domain-containing protein n=2 Tax=Portunus trituberculatus TaxID=210409 RepID=A0A5B7JLA2_PORTR|nr:hypothetical protein [Portunus trituberculatus]